VSWAQVQGFSLKKQKRDRNIRSKPMTPDAGERKLTKSGDVKKKHPDVLAAEEFTKRSKSLKLVQK